MPINQHFADLVDRYSKYELHPEMVEDKDVIIIMHDPKIIINNWEKIKHKRVIWRSIGQSYPLVEKMLLPYREQGMTGIPIVSVSEMQGNFPLLEQRTFEVHEIIENGQEGFVSDNLSELRVYLYELLNNYDLAKEISKNARAKAIQLFGKEKIKDQWREYLSN